jgi:hypothetical protein
MVQFL